MTNVWAIQKQDGVLRECFYRMEFSDDIEEESPCFIVPNSQAEGEETPRRCNLNIESSLKDLVMLRSLPGVNTANSKDTSSERHDNQEYSDRNTDSSLSSNSNERECKGQTSIPEKVTESSSSESLLPHSTSSDDSEIKAKMHSLNSTPEANLSTAVSSYNTMNKQVAHLTPLEGTTDTPLVDIILAKETSSSDCAESTCSLHRGISVRETPSSEDIISPSIEELKTLSSPSDGEKPNPTQSRVKKSTCSEEKPVSECQNDTSLPKWQQDCIPEGVSSVESVGDLTRTSSNSMSNKSVESSSMNDESSLHQWQSQQNSSCDELFENYSQTTHLQVSSSLQAPNQKSRITSPELSQDIFHHRAKGLTDDATAVHQEQSPIDNDVISSSQDDNDFALYLTQSQASHPPSQRRSRPDTEHEKQFVNAASYESADTPHPVPSQSILAQVLAKPRDKDKTEEQHGARNLPHPKTDKEQLGERDEQHCIEIFESPPQVEMDKEAEFHEKDEQHCAEIIVQVETEKEELQEKQKHHCIGNLPQIKTDQESELRERDEQSCIEILETPPHHETDKEPHEKDKERHEKDKERHEKDKEPHEKDKERHEKDKERHEKDKEPHEKDKEPHEKDKEPHETDKEPHEKDKERHEKDKERHEKDKEPHEKDKEPHEKDKEPHEKDKERHEKDEERHEKDKEPHQKDKEPHEKGKEPHEKFTESAESSHVAFHFSPPHFLLRPMLTIALSPCHETSIESQREILNEPPPEEIETSSEFESVLPEVPTTTLSLSAPIPYDENSEDDVNSEVAFNLQKEDLASNGERRTEVVTKPARSIFTNIRERFETSAVREFDEEQDPFEFRDEIHHLPSKKRRRIDEEKDVSPHEGLGENDEERAGAKRRLNDDGDLEECLGKRKKGNKPRAVIDLEDAESSDKEMSQSKARIWKVVKIRTITTTSTMVERETMVIYSNDDGEVLKRFTAHEFDEPTYVTKACQSEEPRVRVEEVPDETSPGNNKENLVISPKKNTKSDNGQRSGAQTNTQRTNKRSISAGRQRALRKSSEDHVTSEAETVQEGSRVLAKWFDKYYYPGTLVSKQGTDCKYRVVFDDGDSSCIRRQDILVVDYLPRDQPVMFRQEHEDCYDNGVIRGFYQTCADKGYEVAQEDGNVHKCPRSRVILDVEQAAIFLSLESSSSKSGEGRTSQASLISSSNSSRVLTSLEQTDIVRFSPRKSADERLNVSTTSPEKATSKSRTAPEKATSKSRTSLEKATSKSRRSLEKATSKSRRSLEKATSKSRTSPEKATSKSRTSPEKATSKSRTSPEKATSKSRTSPEKATSKSRTSPEKATSISRTSPEKATSKSRTSPEKAKKKSRKSRDKVSKQNDVEAFGISSSSETPKSSHKSTAKEARNEGGNTGIHAKIHAGRRARRVRQRLSTALNKAESMPTRTSPRKLTTRMDSQVNDENVIIPTNKDLFRGYGFVITGSDVNHVSEGDENSPREEAHTTFNRRQVIRQVEVGGGVILDNFKENSSGEVSYILLSYSCQTTVKYFHALVAGIPCLSHVWVRDSCTANHLIDYKNYLLPAGRDVITGGLEEKQKCIGALRGMKVHLVGDDDFKDEWKKVLNAAGCQLVNKLPTNVVKQLLSENEDRECDVIVVGSGHVSHSTILKARLRYIPTATIHWLKQSILTGTRVAFNAHPSFTYRAV